MLGKEIDSEKRRLECRSGWLEGRDDAVKAATKKIGDSRGKVIDLRKQMFVPYSPS